jgi:serine phosphatase RsbU (regulator of sigma subunit)
MTSSARRSEPHASPAPASPNGSAPPPAPALEGLLERLRRLAGEEFEVLNRGEAIPAGRAAAEIRAGGLPAGHLLAGGAAAPDPGRLEAAASLAGEWIDLRAESDALADELLQAYERISAGQRLAESFSASSDLQQIGESLLEDAARLLGARSATLRLCDAQGGEWLSLATRAGAAAKEAVPVEDWIEAPVVRLRPSGDPEELGVLRAWAGRGAAPFGSFERRLARSLGEQAGLLLHLGRVLEQARQAESARREREIAREMQSRLLPREDPRPAGVEVAAACLPCAEVCGDGYDYLSAADGALALSVTSVSGRGPAAALALADVRALLRAQAAQSASPAEILRGANRLLARDLQPAGLFATAFLASLQAQGRSLRYASAGHPAALLWRAAAGRFERLQTGGLALGIFDDASCLECETELEDGDIAVVFSDGLTDARDAAGEPFSLERVCQVVMRHRRERPRTLMYRLLEAVEAHRGAAPQQDDLTVMVVRAGRSEP